MSRDELLTIEGTVLGVPSERSPVTTAALVVGDNELPLEHRAAFDVQLADGRRVTIKPAKDLVLRPVRKATGPWRELADHPARPTGDFHPDGHVKLRGEWIVPGERIVVVGYVEGHDFVPDTGGQREAPERQVSLVRAIAIGVGDDAAEDAQRAVKDRERALEDASKPEAAAGAVTWWWLTGSAVVAAIGLAVLDRQSGAETFGLALTALVFALLLFWRASPTVMVPGGAVDPEEITDPGTMVAFHVILFVPIVLLVFWLSGGEPDRRNGLTNIGWVMMGLLPIGKIGLAMLAKPRAENGSQVELPASPARRWILLIGLVALWILSLVLAIPHMKGDGPMI